MAITKKSKVVKKKWSVVAVVLCVGLAVLSFHYKYRENPNRVGPQEMGSFDVQEFFDINS
ncbi:hypothetical protein [Vibrio chagasii]|uniref:hypothetical protein n=1 Tax=Vibrio chagasii TaxID=170679 RepID=UPI003BB5426D